MTINTPHLNKWTFISPVFMNDKKIKGGSFNTLLNNCWMSKLTTGDWILFEMNSTYALEMQVALIGQMVYDDLC